MNSSLVYLYNSLYQTIQTNLSINSKQNTNINKNTITTDNDIHFVIDYNTMTAKFIDKVNNHCKYVTCIDISETTTYKLWEVGNEGDIWKPNIINKDTDINIDLFKSHIEKCVRRMKPIEASQGLMILMLKNPYEALYKLSSICINDVVLTQGYSVIIWLMITIKIKPISIKSIKFINNFVKKLCLINDIIINHKDSIIKVNKNITLNAIIDYTDEPFMSELAALKLRCKYERNTHTIKQMEYAIHYYYNMNEKINIDKYKSSKLIPNNIDFNYQVVYEAIDYTCCYNLINYIYTKPNININESDIRNIIWMSESGVNFRDNKSLKLSEHTKKIYGYTVFKYYLDNFRKDVINKKYDFYKDKKLFIKSHTC